MGPLDHLIMAGHKYINLTEKKNPKQQHKFNILPKDLEVALLKLKMFPVKRLDLQSVL